MDVAFGRGPWDDVLVWHETGAVPEKNVCFFDQDRVVVAKLSAYCANRLNLCGAGGKPGGRPGRVGTWGFAVPSPHRRPPAWSRRPAPSSAAPLSHVNMGKLG